MNEPKLEETRNSLIFLVPKQPFFKWLEEVHKSSSKRPKWKYFEEEDLACLIPRIGTFAQENLEIFMNDLKPKLLLKTLGGLVSDSKYFPEINSSTFDAFFDLKTRDKVWSVAQIQ